MGGNKEDIGRQPQDLQGTLDSGAPQGLNSKKVNYNPSNRRQLVNHSKTLSYLMSLALAVLQNTDLCCRQAWVMECTPWFCPSLLG